MNFYSAPENEWVLSDALRNHGRSYLWDGQDFGQITERIASEAAIDTVSREFLKKSDKGLHRQYRRAKIILRLSKPAVDLLHNSKNGYRAQYYHSVDNGERANRHLLDKLLPLVVKQKNADWLQASLKHKDAKIWIHEGRWLRPPGGMKIHRNLNVARWLNEKEKWARWSKLTPLEEYIELKGAYLDNAGNPASEGLLEDCRVKPRTVRSERLYKYGYT